MPENTLTEWIETSPDTVAAFRILLGERGDTSTVGIVALDESMDRRFPRYACQLADDYIQAAELVASLAEAAGWQTEHPTLRVIAVDDQAKPVTSWQRTHALRFDEEQGIDPVTAMAGEVIRGAAETRRVVSVLCQTLENMEERHGMAIESMIHSRMEQAETEAELELVTTLAEMDEDDEGDPLEVATAHMLEQVAGAMMGKRTTLTPAEAKRLLTESPGLLRELAADQEVVGLFLGALQTPPAPVAAADFPPDLPPDLSPEDQAARDAFGAGACQREDDQAAAAAEDLAEDLAAVQRPPTLPEDGEAPPVKS